MKIRVMSSCGTKLSDQDRKPDTDNKPQCIIKAASWKQATAWSLVLTAMGIPHSLSTDQNQYHLEVENEWYLRARAEIHKYEQENLNWPPVRAEQTGKNRTEKTIWTLLALTAVMGMTFSPEFHAVRTAGAAWAGKIMQGQWWRAATALTLHTDPAHLMGNMLIGGFIMVHTCNYMAPGLAWFLTIISGVAGNLLNAAIQPGHHVAVGSSTAVFGLTGAITTFRAVQDRSSGIRGFLLPVGAGIALLGFTGSAGQHTDIGAHACGFISGLISGSAAGMIVQIRGLPSRTTCRLLGAAALGLPLLAWIEAFSVSGFK